MLPLFVRAGSFIPTADYKMDNTGDYRTDRYTINYYPTSGLSTYTLYEDDLTSPSSLESGNYRLVTFSGQASDTYINIKVATTGHIDGSADNKRLTFVVHRIMSRPASVTSGGKNVKGWRYDPDGHTLRFDINMRDNLDIDIRL